ncbi:hypothetical protein CYL16_06960 [Mycobacterium sp. EPG1]|nr:hypothetical protein CYL16_06960 [Mycobacterium sp. EPG1]
MDLRVFGGVDTAAGAAAAASYFGLDADQSSSAKRALQVALVHDSYLYENREQTPYVTRGALRALERLGVAWLNRDVALRLNETQRSETVGQLAQLHAAAMTMFDQWVEAADWPATAVCYGKGEPGLSRQTRRRMACQVIGCLVALGLEQNVRTGLAAYYSGFGSLDITEFDPISALMKAVPQDQQAWLVTREGPDNAPQFTAVLSTPGRKPVAASGTSKKSAREACARRYLEHYVKVSAEKRSVTRRIVTPKPMELPPATDRAITKYGTEFKLDATSRPLLTQAFIHSSWAYEHRPEIEAARQQDFQILAFMGSHILNFEYVRSVCFEALRNPPEDLSLTAQTDEHHAAISRALRLDDVVLLGRGELRYRGKKVSISSNVFQALIAAIYLSLGEPSTFVDSLPDSWRELQPLLAPGRSRELDPKTLVGAAVAASGLIVSYKSEREGPDHETRFHVVVELDSPVLRRRVAVRGAPARSKSAAEQNAAKAVADVLVALGEQMIDQPPPRVHGSLFLLSHLIATAQANPSLGRLWQKKKLLGAELRDPRLLLKWARAADDVVGQGDLVTVDPAALAEFYRIAGGSFQSSLALRRGNELARVAESIANLDIPSALTNDLESRLVQLCAVYRAAGMQQEDSTLAETIDGWTVLYPDLVQIDGTPTNMVITSGERDTLDYLVSWIADRNTKVSVVIAENQLQIVPQAGSADLDALRTLVDLFSGVSTRIIFSCEDDRINVEILGIEDNTPIVEAVSTALKPIPDALDSAIANLLHDLKNLVTAARQAAVTSPTWSRTERLSAELAASNHLDQARVLALQLGSTKAMTSVSDENTDLSSFLRRYCAQLLERLPTQFVVVPPTLRTEVVVAIDAAALTAVLNNLVKNTQEAAPDGAVLRLDCAARNGAGEIEFADDGPGVPPSVVEALRSGRAVGSSKANGNGLGLASVQKLINRIGGSFCYTGDASGATWRIALPLVDQA